MSRHYTDKVQSGLAMIRASVATMIGDMTMPESSDDDKRRGEELYAAMNWIDAQINRAEYRKAKRDRRS